MYNIYILYGIIHIVEGKMENIEEKKCECGCDKEHCDDSCDCCHFACRFFKNQRKNPGEQGILKRKYG